MSSTPAATLEALGATIKERFLAEKRVLSFEEDLEEFLAHPYRHSRDAARYVHDCFQHFGSYEIDSPACKLRRFRLFDQEFVDGGMETQRRLRLLGHEHVQ